MNAEQILALKPNEYSRLFEKDTLKKQYHQLMLVWHPDRCPDPKASDIAAHLTALYKAALAAIDQGTWFEHGSILVATGGKMKRMMYHTEIKGHGTNMYLGRNYTAVLEGAGGKDLIRHAETVISGLPAAPASMKDEFDALLPKLVSTVTPTASGYVIFWNRERVRLRDLLDKKGPIEPKHVAWIMSGCYNLACYLEYAGATHLGLDVDHVFINPKTHEVSLHAGWEFGAAKGMRPIAAPPDTVKLIGHARLDASLTDPRHHLALIKALGRTCLGDPTGSSLLMRKDIPRPFVRWLQLPQGERPRPEYSRWSNCLTESYGARRFTEMLVTASDIYGD